MKPYCTNHVHLIVHNLTSAAGKNLVPDQAHLISWLVWPEARQNGHNDFWRLYEEQIMSRSYRQKTL